jgi:hypothetical protein
MEPKKTPHAEPVEARTMLIQPFDHDISIAPVACQPLWSYSAPRPISEFAIPVTPETRSLTRDEIPFTALSFSHHSLALVMTLSIRLIAFLMPARCRAPYVASRPAE